MKWIPHKVKERASLELKASTLRDLFKDSDNLDKKGLPLFQNLNGVLTCNLSPQDVQLAGQISDLQPLTVKLIFKPPIAVSILLYLLDPYLNFILGS